MVDQKTLDAFEQMWGLFPEPVMLVHKDRTIIAVNELARTAGVPVSVKCFSLNPEAVTTTCRRCKANLALREHRAVCVEELENGKSIIGYWLPLKDNANVYVHFGVGCAEAMGIRPTTATQDSELVSVAV